MGVRDASSVTGICSIFLGILNTRAALPLSSVPSWTLPNMLLSHESLHLPAGGWHHWAHFRDETSDAQTGRVTSPRAHSQKVADWDSNPRACILRLGLPSFGGRAVLRLLLEGLFFGCWECGLRVQERLDQGTLCQLCRAEGPALGGAAR